MNSSFQRTITRSFRVKVNNSLDTMSRYKPVAIDLDFNEILSRKGIKGSFAKNSVKVVLVQADGKELNIPHALSEDFLYRDSGTVSWVIREPDQLEYYIYFDIEENGPFEFPSQIPVIGNGDVLRYNSGGGEPLDVSIIVQLPVFLDWSGNGKLDLIQSSTYANTLGAPYHGSWFFRNVGTNEEPLYEDFIRLQADGELIETQIFDAMDWNGNGLVDLIGKPYGKNELHVYLNTGEHDRNGLPVLTQGEILDLTDLVGPVGPMLAHNWQLIDLYNDGRRHLVAITPHYDDESPTGHTFGPYIKNYILICENESPADTPPKFRKPYRVKLADGSPLIQEGLTYGALGDWGNDGVWDVMLSETVGNLEQVHLYKNEGSNEAPKLVDAGLLGDGKYNLVAVRYYQNDSFKGFVALDKTSWMLRYFEVTDIQDGRPVLKDHGPLLQKNGRVSVGRYSWPCICDWDGDGGRDIVAGNASGYQHVLEEVGASDPPVYKTGQLLLADQKPIFHNWGNTIGQTGGERTMGYWSPAIVDWNNNGLNDLIAPVGIEAGRLVDGKLLPEGRLLFYQNIGTRNQPEFAPAKAMLLEDGTSPIVSRLAFPIDWNANGQQDLVGFDKDGRLCVFSLKNDPKLDPLTFLPGRPLKMADGSDFTYQTIFDYIGYPWGVNQVVCDWENRGVWDVIVGTIERLIIFRNSGTNEKPAFESGEDLRMWGKPIKLSLHMLRPWPVDWDNTGRVDLLVGSESGWLHLFRRPVFDLDHLPKYVLGDLEKL